LTKSIAIAVAVYQPDFKLFENFLKSLKNQTNPHWEAFFGFDSHPEKNILDLLNSDSRFHCIQNLSRLGSYRNFEALLTHVKNEFDIIFLADQDDIWYPNKINAIVNLFNEDIECGMIYSDSRVRASDGELVSDSLHKLERRKLNSNWQDLLIQNSISGCTMALRSDVLELALPFPETQGWHHDVWLSLISSISSKVCYTSEPLLDYIQHSGNLVGANIPRWGRPIKYLNDFKNRSLIRVMLMNALKLRLEKLQISPNRKLVLEVLYFRILKRSDVLKTLEVALGFVFVSLRQKSADIRYKIGKARRRILSSFMAALSRSKYLRIILKPIKKFIRGRNHQLRTSLTISSLSSQDPHIHRVISSDKSFVIVLPSIEDPLFGGTSTAILFAIQLQRLGRKVKICSYNRHINLPKEYIEKISPLLGVSNSEMQTLLSNSYSREIPIADGDVIIPTAWWTCEGVINAIEKLEIMNVKVSYFVQDFEALFYPADSNYARVLETYRLASQLIINSVPLANFLQREVRDVDMKLVFTPQHLFRNSREEVTASRYSDRLRPYTIVFYGRPSTPRNLFDLGVEGLSLFAEKFSANLPIEFVSVGEKHPDIHLPNGYTMRSLGPLDYVQYENLLNRSDIGLSLMLSPHPSYPPLEMREKNLRVVTNDFLGFKKDILNDSGLSIAQPNPNSIAVEINEHFKSLIRGETVQARIVQDMGKPIEEVAQNLILSSEGPI
jgi:hypothetical protein